MQKYGRTFHLPCSPGATSDDKILHDLSALEASGEIVVTEKMDGENTTIYHGGTHPRSPDARYHPSRDWMKALAAAIAPQLAAGERIVGEYLFARHSIAYDALPSYFMGFACIEDEIFASWDDTVSRLHDLGLEPVPVLYRGPYDAARIDALIDTLDLTRQEGIVMRATCAFPVSDMPRLLAKYVRPDHVTSETHWMNAPLIRNGLL